MPVLKNEIPKRYYTIGEVADMFEVSKSLIRFWENEFSDLRPHKNGKGDRRFTQQNIDQFRIIYDLVKVRRFTLEGAKKELSDQKGRLRNKRRAIEKLQAIKANLEAMRDNL